MKRYILALQMALCVILFTACRQEAGTLGLGMTGDLLGTDYTDTVTLEAHSFLEDSINTTKLSANLAGQLHDPVFGNTTASIFAQFGLTGAGVDFGEQPVVDSVILTLQLSSYYGDTTSLVGIRAYQLTEAFPSTGGFNQNSAIAYDPTPLNFELKGYSIQPNTSIVIDTGKYNPHLRIRLSQAFGQYLLNNSSRMNSTMDFQNLLKGLCISAVSHTGNTGYILCTNMNSALTGIVLYYHNEVDATTQKYTFPCLNTCTRFNRFEHDYNASTDPDFIQQVLQNDTTIGRTKLFAQPTGGVKTKITFPYLKDVFKSLDNKVVINKAELVVSNIAPDEVCLIAPTNIGLQGIKKTGEVTYIPDDEIFTSPEFYGGTYDKNKHEYRFRITQYVQEQILQTGDLSNSINLVVRGSSVRANRLVFGGTDLPDESRLRLEISYTIY